MLKYAHSAQHCRAIELNINRNNQCTGALALSADDSNGRWRNRTTPRNGADKAASCVGGSDCPVPLIVLLSWLCHEVELVTPDRCLHIFSLRNVLPALPML